MRPGTKIIRANTWLPPELEYLADIGGTDQIIPLCKKYRRHALSQGWVDRTDGAIKRQLKLMGISLYPDLDGWTGAGLGKILGLSRDRVCYWCRTGKLTYKSQKGSKYYRILEKDFKEFAKKYPGLLKDIDPFNLRAILEEDLVQFVRAGGPQRTARKPIPVYSSRTGKTYPSFNKAAKEEFISVDAISRSVRTNSPTMDGIRFVKLEKAIAA